MQKWWTVVGPVMSSQVPDSYRQTAESLTGRIPIFLQALAEVKVQELVPALQLDDDERWELLAEKFLETEPVAAMRQGIAGFSTARPGGSSSRHTAEAGGCKYPLLAQVAMGIL